jgi:hypothetical protein
VAATVGAKNLMALTLYAATKQPTLPAMVRAAVGFGPRDIRPTERPVPKPCSNVLRVQGNRAQTDHYHKRVTGYGSNAVSLLTMGICSIVA